MKTLLRITLGNPIQFEQPLGVQKIIQTKQGPIDKCTMVDMPNGDVELRVTGTKYPYVHVIHRESIVEKLYEEKRDAVVIPIQQQQAIDAAYVLASQSQAMASLGEYTVPVKVDKRTKAYRDAKKASESQ